LAVTLDVPAGAFRFEWARLDTGEVIAKGRLLPPEIGLLWGQVLNWILEGGSKAHWDGCNAWAASTRALTRRIRKLFPVLQQALEQELAGDLARVRARQENSLRRELERVDDYFENYERELNARAARSSSQNARTKTTDRLAAAKAEHSRRRADQLARHEIRLHPHLDALLLVAENAWCARLRIERAHHAQEIEALFIPRARRWEAGSHKQVELQT
jgi:hypothetical protein